MAFALGDVKKYFLKQELADGHQMHKKLNH